MNDKKKMREQMLVNQAIASAKQQLVNLENSRKKYIEAAAAAKADGIASQYNMAKNAIRLVIEQKAIVNQMLLNLQMSAQMNDMTEMTKAFADGMKILSGSIVETANSMNFTKVSAEVNKAAASTQVKQAQAEDFMESVGEGISALADSGSFGDEIDAMIFGQAQADGGVDSDIAELEKKLKSSV